MLLCVIMGTCDTSLLLLLQLPVPAQSHSGDAELVLDSGEVLRAHSQLLQLSSATMAQSIANAAVGKPIRLSLPGLTQKQVLLLLHALYAMPKAAIWADTLSLAELRALATTCHALGCTGLLEVSEAALMKRAGSFIAAHNVLDLYRQARELGMPGFQKACAKAMVKLLPNMYWQLQHDSNSDGLVPILLEVVSQRTLANQMDSDLLRMVEKLQGLRQMPGGGDMTMESAAKMLKE